jgi:3'-phosphoadenosine 5'-phosphosulfate (PAPS) 3'-phosphatase
VGFKPSNQPEPRWFVVRDAAGTLASNWQGKPLRFHSEAAAQGFLVRAFGMAAGREWTVEAHK